MERDIKKFLPEMPSEEELAEAWERRQQQVRQDQNCITYWFPKIQNYVPTPRTEIVSLDLDREQDKELWGYLDGGEPPSWWHDFTIELANAAQRISSHGPWFLRTGVFSGKHDFNQCCRVTDLGGIGIHALNLFEFSQIVDPVGLPYHRWAIREWLNGPHILEYERFGGMPLRREFRAFAKDGEVLCIHPYWVPAALDQAILAMPEFQEMSILGEDEESVRDLASRASKCVEGEWSIDCLWTNNGWYVTDMAIAQKSYHWPDCERLQGSSS